MVENKEENNSPFIQDRLSWFAVYHFLNNLSDAASEQHLNPKDTVHIGGTALFYRCYQTFGPRAVFHYRGTRDMDVLSFKQGMVPSMISAIARSPESAIADYSITPSHLPDKKSIHITLGSNNPGPEFRKFDPKKRFEVDLYESPSGQIEFNKRVISREKIILDPPEVLDMSRGIYSPYVQYLHEKFLVDRSGLGSLETIQARRLIAVPSLRDAFVIKMDILDYARALRLKDQLDILTMIRLVEEDKADFDELFRALMNTSSLSSALLKLANLEELFMHPQKELLIPADYPFLPSKEALTQAVKDVRRFRDYELYKKTEPS